jgi:hypothetical protein
MQSDEAAVQQLRYPPGAPLWEPASPPSPEDAGSTTRTLIVYTQSTQLVGQVDPARRRLSDYLNDPSRSYLELTAATVAELLAERPATAAAAQVTLRKGAIWLACPQDPPSPATARTPTHQRPLTLVLGLFSVRGQLHRRSHTTTALLPLLSGEGRRFIPLSAAQVRYLPNPHFDTEAAVVLVNTACIDYWTTN